MIGLAVTEGRARLHQLRHARRLRQRHPQRAGALQGEIEVLLMQRDPEPRVECAFDHAFAMYFQNARRRESAHQGLTHPRWIGARF